MMLARVAPEKAANPTALPTSTLGFTTRDGGRMAHEQWRDIAGYEGFYQVSDMGRVRSLTRTFLRSDGSTATYKGRVLVPLGNPYHHVTLSKGNVASRVRIHRLVAQTFLPNPDGLNCVDHINGIKTDNRAANLRWRTSSENIRYAADNGLMHTKPYALYSDEMKERMVADKRKAVIRDDGEVYPSITSAAKALDVSRPAVGHVLMGLVDTCKGHTFRYA